MARVRDRIDAFVNHFESETLAIGDDSLERELGLMDDILAAADQETGAAD